MVTIVYILNDILRFSNGPGYRFCYLPELLALLGSDYPGNAVHFGDLVYVGEEEREKTGEPGVAKYGIGIRIMRERQTAADEGWSIVLWFYLGCNPPLRVVVRPCMHKTPLRTTASLIPLGPWLLVERRLIGGDRLLAMLDYTKSGFCVLTGPPPHLTLLGRYVRFAIRYVYLPSINSGDTNLTTPRNIGFTILFSHLCSILASSEPPKYQWINVPSSPSW